MQVKVASEPKIVKKRKLREFANDFKEEGTKTEFNQFIAEYFEEENTNISETNKKVLETLSGQNESISLLTKSNSILLQKNQDLESEMKNIESRFDYFKDFYWRQIGLQYPTNIIRSIIESLADYEFEKVKQELYIPYAIPHYLAIYSHLAPLSPNHNELFQSSFMQSQMLPFFQKQRSLPIAYPVSLIFDKLIKFCEIHQNHLDEKTIGYSSKFKILLQNFTTDDIITEWTEANVPLQKKDDIWKALFLLYGKLSGEIHGASKVQKVTIKIVVDDQDWDAHYSCFHHLLEEISFSVRKNK